MKWLFVTIIATILLALSGGQAYAQRCLPGMKGVELRGGLVCGSSGDYCLGAAMSVYSACANHWMFGAEYLHKSYGYRDMSIPRAVHRRRRILSQFPVGCAQDLLHVARRFRCRRI